MQTLFKFLLNFSAILIGVPYLVGYAHHNSFFHAFGVLIEETKLSQSDIFLGSYRSISQLAKLEEFSAFYSLPTMLLVVQSAIIIWLVSRIGSSSVRKTTEQLKTKVTKHKYLLASVFYIVAVFVAAQLGNVTGVARADYLIANPQSLPVLFACHRKVETHHTTSCYDNPAVSSGQSYLLHSSDKTLFVIELAGYHGSQKLIRLNRDDVYIYTLFQR